jgi:hypothetical protein
MNIVLTPEEKIPWCEVTGDPTFAPSSSYCSLLIMFFDIDPLHDSVLTLLHVAQSRDELRLATTGNYI